MDDVVELLREAWEHRGDGYWWADHALLQAVLIATAAGSVGLAFKYAEVRMIRAMTPPLEVPRGPA